MAMPATEAVTTHDAILAVAIDLIGTVGFTALSYRDIAQRVGITTASIHYHFPAKADLGLAVVAHLRQLGDELWAGLETSHPRTPDRLRALADLLAGVTCAKQRSCPINTLQSEFGNLTPPMQAAVSAWVRAKIEHIARWLEAGRRNGELAFRGEALDQARLVWSVLEYGAQLARTNPEMPFQPLADQMLRTMAV